MKISKYPIIFGSFFTVLVGLFSFVFVKYYPFLFKNIIYHCQHLDCSRLVRIATEAGVTVFQFMVLFIALTIIKLIINFITIYFHRKRVLKAIVKRNKIKSLVKILGLDGHVLVVANKKPFAFCLGFTKPKIILSTTLIKIMNSKELETILIHEKYHLEHKDAIVALLAIIVKSLFPFLPFISDFAKLYFIERETKADNQAIKIVNSRIYLISSLKKLLMFDSSPAFSTIPSFMGVETLEARIRFLTQNNNNIRSFNIKSVSLSIFSFLVLLSLTFVPLRTFDQGKGEVVTCVSTSSCSDTCLQTPESSLLKSSH